MTDRIVFLGSSTTDGFTYPMLARQALEDARLSLPVFINAGVGGDTAAQMLARIERDVLRHRPTKCFVQAGANDAARKTPPADFTASLRAILQRLKDAGIAPLLLTLNSVPAREAEFIGLTTAYNAAVRALADEFNCPVGDVYGPMKSARESGALLAEPDGTHPNFAGYRLIARAVLDLLGQPALAVPEELRVALRDGLLKEWKITAAPADSGPLTPEQVAALRPQSDWKTLTLPESTPQSHWWLEHVRQEGFALSLKALAGAAKNYWGVATFSCDRAKPAFFNTGAHLNAVWLNGAKIFQAQGWTGFHAGKERIPIQLVAGQNAVVIETGEAFFASFTDDDQW